MDHNSICLVIPVYNESQRLKIPVFRGFLESYTGVYLVFVDDSSADGSRDIILSLCNDLPQRVFLITNPLNQGKANSIRNGILYAFDHLPVGLIGFLDADLSVLPDDFISFEAALSSSPALAVYGFRDREDKAAVKRDWLRKTMSIGFRSYVRHILRIKIYDTQCGAKLFKRSCIRMLFDRPFQTRWLVDLEIILRWQKELQKPDLSSEIIELPVSSFEEKAGSKLTPKEFLRSFKELILITVYLNR